MTRPFLACLLLLAPLGCGAPRKPAVHVFAAASTREALEEVARQFQAETGTPVECSLAASSALARQIEQGADAELFLSADERWADYLAERGLVGHRRDLLANRLVVVVPRDSGLKLTSLAGLAGDDVKHLALALEPVPAGRYARAALKKAGVWGRVKDRVREGGDVRAALTFVARGEAEAGIVYATDATATSQVRVALEVPEELHEPVRYPLVLLRAADAKPEARAFYDYLGGEKAAAVFRRAGFQVVR
ncbi:MAG TPA: molybdate ABC transporter substrate-binding protein [Gemmataceae bacterium]|jgi:molybdate transport system substrate-binding protein|nr:molybdate ABC transporter substrate-binding protein [Gemmataceae bacterium]